MRILLAHNSTYYPAHGGGDRSNRLLMEALAARGHAVRVITRVEQFGADARDRLLADLAARGVRGTSGDSGEVRFHLNGVDVRALASNPRLRSFFADHLAEFDPEIVITSTDDPAQLLFDLAIKAPRARVVHLIRATIAVPFGPDSSSISADRTMKLRQADGVVGVSEYVAEYAREHGGLDAVHVPISLMEPGDAPMLADLTNPYVSMVNPCAVKGIAILLELADRMPHVQFAAVPMWGTTAADLEDLRRRPNIALLGPYDDINDLLKQTSILLVPSVWAEARSRMVVEAMLRGVPVLGARAGGIPEAMQGVDYLLPVNPVRQYRRSVNEMMVPVAEVPTQDVGPWQETLQRLLDDPELYRSLSERSRKAAQAYVEGLTAEPFEAYLLKLTSSPKRAVVQKPAAVAPGATLSAEKRRLLALMLQKKQAAKRLPAGPWLPWLEEVPPGGVRLICFPFAGGGALSYRPWKEPLAEQAAVSPVRFPGREERLTESPYEDMASLLDALVQAFSPALAGRFCFFGHSMGAVIAFELARKLRAEGKPGPLALFVSGARAPQFRLGHIPGADPGDQQFLEELRRLEGMPPDILENPELLQLVLPALRADTRLYRRYVYQPGEPLTIPLFAYGGASDPNVTPTHLESWRDQTTGFFQSRLFAGGHFFLQSDPQFLPALAEDLESVSA